MNYNKDKIYKLRGVLEDWNKSSKDEKKDNLYWMNDEGFLRESEIVEDALDLLRAGIPQLLDTSWLEDNYNDSRFGDKTIDEAVLYWFEEYFKIEDYKKEDPAGEEWTSKVIAELKECIANALAASFAKAINKESETLLKEINKKQPLLNRG